MKQKTRHNNKIVYCQINGCGRPFVFTSPEQLTKCNVMNLAGQDLHFQEYAFVCSVCRQRYPGSEEGEEWQED